MTNDASTPDFFGALTALAASPPVVRVGPYAVIRAVARGGQGAVYHARDTRDGSSVALKRAHSDHPSNLARLRRGAELAASLDHPDILAVTSIETVDDELWIATPWIDGTPVDDWAREAGRTVAEIITAFTRIAAAVAHAHFRGVIHRDLRPANLLMRADDRPCVLDFGIARRDGDDAADISAHTHLVGNLRYLPPERLRARGAPVDVRHDIFALGVLLHVMLTGSHPLDGCAPAECLERMGVGDLFGRSDHPSLTRSRRAIIRKATSSDISARYPSVTALIDDLTRDRRGLPVHAVAHTLRYRAARFARRHRAALAFSAVLAIAGGILVARQVEAERLARTQRADDARTVAMLTEFFEDLGPDRALGPALDTATILDHLAPSVEPLRDADDASTRRRSADLDRAFGMSYLRVGHFAHARPHLEQAFDRYSELLSANAAVRHQTAAALARSISETDGPVAAEAFTRSLIGDAPIDAIRHDRHLYNLAGALTFQHRTAEARPWLDAYLDRAADDPEALIDALHLDAIWHNRAGTPARALASLDAASSRAASFFGPHAVPTLRLTLLAMKSRQLMGHHAEVVDQLAPLRPTLEAVFGPRSPEYREGLARLAISRAEIDDVAHALDTAETLHRLATEIDGPDHWNTIQARFVLAHVLLVADRPTDVLPLLEPEIERVRLLRATTPKAREQPTYWVARALNDLGEHERAADLLERALGSLDGVLAPTDALVTKLHEELARCVEARAATSVTSE